MDGSEFDAFEMLTIIVASAILTNASILKMRWRPRTVSRERSTESERCRERPRGTAPKMIVPKLGGPGCCVSPKGAPRYSFEA